MAKNDDTSFRIKIYERIAKAYTFIETGFEYVTDFNNRISLRKESSQTKE